MLAIGLRFGPEGAMYVTDWMTGWDSKEKGRIWKLDAAAAAGSATRKEVLTLLRADLRARPAAGVAALLRHADMRIRQKAQFELARRDDAQTLWRQRRATRRRVSAGCTRIWGSGRWRGGNQPTRRLLAELLEGRRRRGARPGREDDRRRPICGRRRAPRAAAR